MRISALLPGEDLARWGDDNWGTMIWSEVASPPVLPTLEVPSIASDELFEVVLSPGEGCIFVEDGPERVPSRWLSSTRCASLPSAG